MDSYAGILSAYGLKYTPAEYYWQVGALKKTQGWILHLSVITAQLPKLLNIVIPILITGKVVFKIIRDPDTAKSIMDGSLGYMHLGKMVSIYPKDDQEAVDLAKKLISLTSPFRGPAIPTDRQLGTIVYTCPNTDPCAIPFVLPPGTDWPFNAITTSSAPKRGRLLKNTYYPLAVLKPDAKGDVLKAVYFRRAWQIQACLLKQGRLNMFADALGRDIQDRLKWQFDLFQDLSGDLPLPKIFDYFRQNGDSYLAMEFIKGITLSAWIDWIFQDRCWLDLPHPSHLQLLNYFDQILVIISRLHGKGYIHRDITPDNFIVDKKGRIFLIDLELAWSSHSGQPDPPFELGTPGYMSPEQYKSQRPTVKEDIYAIGGLILAFFTHLPPIKLNGQPPDLIKKKLLFFTGEPVIGDLLVDCWETAPSQRPELSTIQEALRKYRQKLKPGAEVYCPQEVTNNDIKAIVRAGLSGLALPQLLSPKHRWLSRVQRKESRIGNAQLELTLYEGWHTGMVGPLWLVARAKRIGFDVDVCKTAYTSSWEYIQDHYFKEPARSIPGLYAGGAGIALALTEGLNSGLLYPDPDILGHLEQCFSQMAIGPDLSKGWAGQGLALLQAAPWLNKEKVWDLLRSYVNNLVNSQQKEGSLNTDGVAGIALFLLTYIQHYPDSRAEKSVNNALHRLVRKKGDLSTGTILSLIKSYEVLKDPLHRKIAEAYLQKLPPHPVRIDLTLQTGLAGWGEIYLEAFRVFNNPEWQARAAWITQILVHCFKETRKGLGYWLPDTSNITTADLFTGNSGILHFLIRYLSPAVCSHPLSPGPSLIALILS